MKRDRQIDIETYSRLREIPFKVPDGYFERFTSKVMAELPPYPAPPQAEENRPLWSRVKPYVYLAAMFVGVWCMIKVLHAMSDQKYSLDNPPEAVVLALNDADTYDFYSGDYYSAPRTGTDVSDMELQEEVGDMYEDIEDFEEAFGYELESEYENMDLSQKKNLSKKK